LPWKKADVARYEPWLMACHELYARSLEKTAEVYASIEEAIPGINVSQRLRDPRVLWKTRLRLLNYKQVQLPGEVLAKFHPDRDYVTLHLGENWKGLCFDPEGGQRQSYEAQTGKVLVFPGAKANAATNGKLRALMHGVVAPEDSKPGLQRQSAVFFAHI
jgi:isopenicillin N synthase-like dioxygenase